MSQVRLSPYIRIAWDHTLHPPNKINRRALFDYELIYVKSGEMKVLIEDVEYRGVPGDIFLLKPRQHHSIDCMNDRPVRQPHLHFDLVYQPDSPTLKTSFLPMEAMSEQELRLFREDVTQELPNHFRLRHPVIFEKLLFDIIHEYESKHPYFETAATGLFLQLWAQLAREHLWSTHAAIATNWVQLERVKSYLNQNVNKDVTLDELSSVANLSSSYLCRLFKKTFGVGPIRYHLIGRIEHAKKLIQFTDLPITEISELCGFLSIHSFSRAFRNAEGVPPTYYRNLPSKSEQ
ncbi:AraC family transcriptional regulator [Paenibacillus sp.]|uniref:helix-turn-helix transcriptional regulator n=1 Tax=Paenibacillus sp. TaxID=58172 RepID=UPI002811528C|nr:AraC family transcriptional regulator [Paenibacillus sp.]